MGSKHRGAIGLQNDKQLALRIAQGDRRAFAEFVDTYGPAIHRLVRRYAVNESDAEDLTQEIFVSLTRSIASYRGVSSLATWVYRVAANHCLKYRERMPLATVTYEETMHEQVDPEGDPTLSFGRRELSSQIQTALDALSPEHRDVVILHSLHGQTYAECAQILSVPVGTVKSRLSNAFRRLRERLGNYVLGEASLACAESVPETPR